MWSCIQLTWCPLQVAAWLHCPLPQHLTRCGPFEILQISYPLPASLMSLKLIYCLCFMGNLSKIPPICFNLQQHIWDTKCSELCGWLQDASWAGKCHWSHIPAPPQSPSNPIVKACFWPLPAYLTNYHLAYHLVPVVLSCTPAWLLQIRTSDRDFQRSRSSVFSSSNM